MSHSDLPSLLFTPYQPTKPASGWRFFGRRRELDRLLYSEENLLVVGPRRIGKTSLLQEANRRLSEMGEKVYFVDVQHCRDAGEFVKELIHKLSTREAVTAVRRSRLLDEKLLASVLKQLASRGRNVVIIIDELGNLIFRRRQEDWESIGLLRSFSQAGRIRIVMSGFQEFFLKQMLEFEGPFVNFASPMRVSSFSATEVEEALIDPLSIWGRISNRAKLRRLVIAKLGGQPFLLQHLGFALFERLTGGGNRDILTLAARMLEGEEITIFQSAVEEVFYRMLSSTVRHLFLRRCLEARKDGLDLREAEIDDSWVESVLNERGHKSSVSGRRLLLEELEMRGFTSAVGGTRSRQRIDAPLLFEYLERTETSLSQLSEKFGDEMALEKERFLPGLD